jgi:4'-phosphopantetheinyl transferase
MAELRRLAELELDLWVITLERCRDAIDSLRQLLNPEERSRADRFRSPEDRERHVIAHGALRRILADYVPADPAGLLFRVANHGKPALVRDGGWPDIRFNLSHAWGIAVCAVAAGREVGVDIERIDAAASDLQVADQFFSAREVAALHRLPADQRARGFFNCWTRKEAYIKGRGEGLSMPLDAFNVSLAPGEPAALLGSRSENAAPGRGGGRARAIAHGYAAALAIEGSGAAMVDVRTSAFMPA